MRVDFSAINVKRLVCIGLSAAGTLLRTKKFTPWQFDLLALLLCTHPRYFPLCLDITYSWHPL
jgi:hypothetical protein